MVAKPISLLAPRRWIAAVSSVLVLLGAMVEPQAAASESLVTICIECHQDRGPLAAQLPRIEGQNADYLAQELERFRTAHRTGFPMQAMASNLARDDIHALAAELAARPWGNRPQRVDNDAAAKGLALASGLACSSCHGPSFLGAGAVPRLAGQNPEYLARQLRAFESGHRQLSLPAAARSMSGLRSPEIDALAHYLAKLDGQIHLDWLTGQWCGHSGVAHAEAWWSRPQGGLLIGMHRHRDGTASAVAFGFMRIAIEDGAAVYYEQPSGAAAIPFELIEVSAQHAVFASDDRREAVRRIRWQRFDRTLQGIWEDDRGSPLLQLRWTVDCTGRGE